MISVSKVQIGTGGIHPAGFPFSLDSNDPNVQGMPPVITDANDLPVLQIGYDAAASRWTMFVQSDLTSSTRPSEAYVQITSANPLSSVQSTGLWGTDKAARPTLLMNRTTGLSDQAVTAGLGAEVLCASVTAADFDNDMDIDLFLACGTGASNTADILYVNQGNGTFVAQSGTGGAAGAVGSAIGSGAGTADTVIAGDYDADGFMDLFVTNGMGMVPLYVGGSNKLFRNNGNLNSWVELDLVGTQSDRDATGAKVYATANSVTQLHIQNGGYHRWAQDSKRIHFGLAGASTVNLNVQWPSGAVENFIDVPVNHLYRITEGSGIQPIADQYFCKIQ